MNSRFLPLLQFLLILALHTLVSCTVPARNNGARIIPTSEVWPGAYFDWSGGQSPKGFANGEGIATWYDSSGTKVEEFRGTYAYGMKNGPFTQITYTNGQKNGQITGTYTNGIRTGECEIFYHIPYGTDRVVHDKRSYDSSGYYHGHAVTRYENGGRYESDWSHGTWYRSEEFNPDGSTKQVKTPGSSSSYSSSDTDIVGAMLGLGGVAAGDANLVMGGISMMAGDEAGTMHHMANVGGGSGASSSATSLTSSTTTAQPAAKKKVPHRDNLITKYGLRRFQGKGGQMDSYISHADAAFSRWQQTGEEKYYTEHQEVADIAAQFDKQTRTEGTRMIR